MATIESAGTMSGAGLGILDRERTIAAAGYNRWLVPPAALCIHLCIGMAYGFSVFWLPLSRAVGITATKVCQDMSLTQELFTTTCDWRVASMGWMYTLFFVLLGALGIYIHQLWLLWLGSGVIGGVGLGLGYISPVSTLVKWFPDRRGMATGMAIMGFGGGALIGAPLANLLINYFKTPTDVGVWQTFATLAAIYFVFMMAGALGYRVPPEGWQPAKWDPSQVKAKKLVTDKHVHLSVAWRTPQFWLL